MPDVTAQCYNCLSDCMHVLRAERALPVSMNEMLLRGCMLKNSNYVLGLVVYTGRESRIQMNAAATPNKVGARLFWCSSFSLDCSSVAL